MAVLVIASIIVTIYVALYFVYNVKQIAAVKNKNKSIGKEDIKNKKNIKNKEDIENKEDIKNSENKGEGEGLWALVGSALLLLSGIGATALIWALV